MHLAIHTLAATSCALSASALPLPQTDIGEPLTLDIPSGKWYHPFPNLFDRKLQHLTDA